ncbi:DUF554 domain-containing protein [Brucepastera parasyntrophica]|uniref:DUF554 domain-containing protein n=1 Tax=Brucepastera parasyntrophica TaxID=2880008 RepID=UPI00210E0ACC|nr:DUF554 domain-containing protein [Brucepastera parasyntrophica]ULQ59689.1 DUF554 domain-containing protein [Brucepastera parasyntrophica]
MLGTIVNCITVIAGSLIGMLFAGKISEEISDVICSGAGVVTLVIGFQMAFATQNIIYMTLSLILGGLIGSKLDIDGKILRVGLILEKRVKKADKNPAGTQKRNNANFPYAFLNASVLFCVGAMAIVGSFKAGTENDYTLLYTKSVLDGFMAIVFGAAMGIGTAFSALTILVYQGGLTILSVFIKPYVSELMINELSAIGGAFIVMIGINLLNLRKLKTANYLPAMLFIIIFVLIDPFIQKIAAVFI